MAQQTIDTTTLQPNGKQGEPIRTAFEKSNANFTELYTGLSEAQGGANASLKKAQNLADLADPAAARDNLELGSAAQGDLQMLSCHYYGSVEPETTWPGMVWADSGTGWSKRRNSANDAWINEFRLFTELAKKIGDATQRFKVAESLELDDATNRSEVFGLFSTQSATPPSTGVLYTNTSGKPKLLMIEGSATGGGSYIHIQIAGRFAPICYAPATGNAVSGWAIVPKNKTYLITQAGLSSYLVTEFT